MVRLSRDPRTLIVVALVVTVGFVSLQGQRDTVDGGELKALVGEVRALRVAIERAAASSNQSQLLLGRVQLQENRLATLSRQYQEARTRTLDAQMAQARVEGELRRMVNAYERAIPVEERRALEDQIGRLKSSVAQEQARTGQLRSDENAAAEMLSIEQQRWSDFNQRLETIERQLSRDPVPPE